MHVQIQNSVLLADSINDCNAYHMERPCSRRLATCFANNNLEIGYLNLICFHLKHWCRTGSEGCKREVKEGQGEGGSTVRWNCEKV